MRRTRPTRAHVLARTRAQAQDTRSVRALRELARRGLTQAVPAAGLQDPPGSLLSVLREAGAVQQVWVGAQCHHLGGQRCGLGSKHPPPRSPGRDTKYPGQQPVPQPASP